MIPRSSESDPVLLVHVRRLEVPESLPNDVAPLSLLVEPDLDVVLDHFVAEEQHLFAAGDGCGALGQAADGQVGLGL